MLTAGWKSLVEARSAYQRLAKVIESEPNEPAAMKLPSPKGALSVENLLFGFRGQELPVIRRVSFALAPGESLAIIGPSAAGKSTLARELTSCSYPEIGQKIGGRDHSTVMYAHSKVAQSAKEDRSLQDDLQSIRSSLSR